MKFFEWLFSLFSPKRVPSETLYNEYDDFDDEEDTHPYNLYTLYVLPLNTEYKISALEILDNIIKQGFMIDDEALKTDNKIIPVKDIIQNPEKYKKYKLPVDFRQTKVYTAYGVNELSATIRLAERLNASVVVNFGIANKYYGLIDLKTDVVHFVFLTEKHNTTFYINEDKGAA